MTIPDKALAFARQQIGKPYIWGGEGPKGYDCSGLVHQSYVHAGLKLADSTADGYMSQAVKVSRSALKPGMLVRPHKGHIQIYAGNGRIVEAPKRGVPIREVPMWGFLDGGYFRGTFASVFASHKYPGYLIRRGSTGTNVRLIQAVVKTTADGVFGPKTESAVKVYQRKHGLSADGIVGPATWRVMFG